MSSERVIVTVDKQVYSIERQELGRGLKYWNEVSKTFGKRPGEPTGPNFANPANFSFDKLGTLSVIHHSQTTRKLVPPEDSVLWRLARYSRF